MDIRVLRYFLAVAREGNISGAAKNLHVTQPTLSRQLMELETELGVKLFLRGSGNRSITLTEEGFLLRKRAEEILQLVERTESELAAPGENIGGSIHIGSGETYVINLLFREIKVIRDAYPDIRFHIFSGNADYVTEQLDNGLIDLGILTEPSNIAKYDSIPLPVNDTWGLLMRRDHALAEKDSIEPGDLGDIPLIGSSQHLVGGAFSKWLNDDYEKLNLVATYTLLYNASLLVKNDIGCALCLDKIISTSEGRELCFRPLKPKLEARWHIVWKKHQVHSKAAALFIKRLQEVFAG